MYTWKHERNASNLDFLSYPGNNYSRWVPHASCDYKDANFLKWKKEKRKEPPLRMKHILCRTIFFPFSLGSHQIHRITQQRNDDKTKES